MIARSRLPAQEAMACWCFTGMAGGDGKALVFISHEGSGHDAVVKNQEHEGTSRDAGEAADPVRCRRGFEPMRIVIMPQ